MYRRDDNPNGEQSAEVNEIVAELSEEERLRQEVIQSLLEPCDRITYGERQREVAANAAYRRTKNEVS